MKKILSALAVFGVVSLCIPLYAQNIETPNFEMRHHRHRHRDKSDDCGCERHHSHERGHKGATGPTGPTGPKGQTGSTGPTGGPSFGYFYSTSLQAIDPGEAVFFENQNFPARGPAFTFTPGIGPNGESFQILQTGYYAINYGLFVVNGFFNEPPPPFGLALTLNGTTIPNSLYYPLDFISNNGDMASFAGIFHLPSTGTLQLINIGTRFIEIAPPLSNSPESTVTTSAYISIQFLSPD